MTVEEYLPKVQGIVEKASHIVQIGKKYDKRTYIKIGCYIIIPLLFFAGGYITASFSGKERPDRLEQRIVDLENSNKQLTDLNKELESTNSQLRTNITRAEEQLSRAENELRNANKSVGEIEQSIRDSNNTVDRLRERISDIIKKAGESEKTE